MAARKAPPRRVAWWRSRPKAGPGLPRQCPLSVVTSGSWGRRRHRPLTLVPNHGESYRTSPATLQSPAGGQQRRQPGHRRPGGRGQWALAGLVEGDPGELAVLGRLLVAGPALPGGGQVPGVGPLAVVEAAEGGQVERLDPGLLAGLSGQGRQQRLALVGLAADAVPGPRVAATLAAGAQAEQDPWRVGLQEQQGGAGRLGPGHLADGRGRAHGRGGQRPPDLVALLAHQRDLADREGGPEPGELA